MDSAMASFLFLPILPAFWGRHGYRLAFVVSSKALTRDSRVQTALSGCPAGRQSKVRGDIQIPSSHPAGARPTESNSLQQRVERTTFLSGCPGDARLFGWQAGVGANPRLRPRRICASVPLLNWVSPISARIGRHEDRLFSCEPDRLRRAQDAARYCRADRGWSQDRK